MLVLSRNPNEEIWIGDSICVKIISTRGNRVRVGIVAPSDYRISRDVRPSVYHNNPKSDADQPTPNA